MGEFYTITNNKKMHSIEVSSQYFFDIVNFLNSQKPTRVLENGFSGAVLVYEKIQGIGDISFEPEIQRITLFTSAGLKLEDIIEKFEIAKGKAGIMSCNS